MILNIDLVSDFVCPWCFLGAVRLDRALAELRATRPDIEPRINWLPFFLNPDTPPA
ncbi:MAG: DsbA family protein, partial [Proteobacteria bacterium]|nr:DsbA family protein [Pseudomonadota bacterium]